MVTAYKTISKDPYEGPRINIAMLNDKWLVQKTYQNYSVKCIADSKKVALGIGHWALGIGKLLFGSHSSKSLHCSIYAQMPNVQCPISNDQLPKQPFLFSMNAVPYLIL